MSKLVLIDGNAILHRAYHALPPLSTKAGEPINAVYGLVSMLLRAIQDLEPTHIAVCFDRKEPTFRHEEFKDYQAHRPPMEKSLSSQFDKAKNVLAAMNVPVFEMAGYEADDLIGTLAQHATRKSRRQNKIDEVVIVTGDRDILQLVDDSKGIRVYLPKKGLSDAKLMKSEDVVEKLGVAPEQIPDYKALVGDPSDNYPGVAGVGPKTAANLLRRYKTVEQVYRNLNKIPSSIAEKLKKYKKDVKLYQKLARIVVGLDLDTDLNKAGNWQVDSPEVLDLFAEFGFKTLSKRTRELGKKLHGKDQLNLL